MTTRWKVVYHNNSNLVLDETGTSIAETDSRERAESIVRDHNRAEAFEAMREALHSIKAHDIEYEGLEDWETMVANMKHKARVALALADTAESEG